MHEKTISIDQQLYITTVNSCKKIKSKSNSLKLISNDILKLIPKDFTITTKNGSYQFNKELLKETSYAISNYIEEFPDESTYNIDIIDPHDVMRKFEKLYNGDKVYFEQNEIRTCIQITTLLIILCCPNFMKQKKLRNNSTVNCYSHVKFKGIKKFIKKKEFNTFTIITNKTEYSCNIFGICSSKILRERFNTQNKEFIYDYGDDINEFKFICNLFNFNEVEITSNNVDTLKQIAEDLQIECISKGLNNYSQNSEKVSQILDDNQTIIDSIDSLFDWLYSIKDKTVSVVTNLILKSEWINTEESVQELVAFLLEVISIDILLHPYLIDLIIELDGQSNDSNYLKILIPFIVSTLLNYLYNNDKCMMPKCQNKPKKNFKKKAIKKMNPTKKTESENKNQFIYMFIYKLYKKGIIQKHSLIDSLKNYDFQNDFINLWFLPLFYELDKSNIDKIIQSNDQKSKINEFINLYLPDKIDLYEQMLDNGEPGDILTKALRNDDIDTFQSIFSRILSKDNSKLVIPYNVYDNHTLENVNYLNYAAAFGSLKCFKYLLLNDFYIDDKTFEYAVYGCNIEIIKIVDQKCNNNNNKNGKEITFAILKHSNDIFDWLMEKHFNKSLNMSQFALSSAKHGNAHCLSYIINVGFDINNQIIEESLKYGFYHLSKFLKKVHQYKPRQIYYIENDLFIIKSGNLSIFKLFANRINTEDIYNYVSYAAKNNYLSIINYYFEELHKKDSNIPKSINKILAAYLKRNDFQLFKNLLQKIDSAQFDFYINYSYLIQKSFKNKNVETIKEIIDMTLAKYPNYNFLDEFKNAALLGLNDICQYFIIKNVSINYNLLAEGCKKFGMLNKNIYSMILNKIKPILKTRFLMSIGNAIKNKNHELVDYLFQENAKCENALSLAVNTRDIDLVNIVLKYINEPYLINKIGSKGNALNIAVNNNDLEIVKKLLSLPGIDPSICENKDEIRFPLTIAIHNLNIDIVNAILDFYGENIQYQKQQLDEAVKAIILLYNKFTNNSSALKIINRILEIKYINPNITCKVDFKPCELNSKTIVDDEEEEEEEFEEEEEEEFEEEEEEFIDEKEDSILTNEFYYKYFQYYSYKKNKWHVEPKIKTLLISACAFNNIDIIKKLLNMDTIDVNQYSLPSGDTGLITSIRKKNLSIAKLLINDSKTNINHRTFNNETAFLIAVKKRYYDIIDILMKDKRFNSEESRVNYSYFISNTKIKKMILSSNIIKLKDEEYSYSLFKAIKTNDIKFVNFIVQNNFFDKSKVHINDLIILALKTNRFKIFQKLIKLMDDDVNLRDSNNISLLSHVTSNLNEKMLDYILNNDKFDAKKSDILDAFIQTFSNNKKLPKGKDISTDITRTQMNIMNKLYDYDKEHDRLIDFTKLLPNGKSFFTSITNNYFKGLENVIQFFIDHGADPNVPDFNKMYPLEDAIRENSFEMVELLINTNKIDYSMKIPKKKYNDFGDIDQNEYGFTTYLHLAALSENLSIVKEFIERNLIDINVTDDLGNTPLMDACLNNNYKCFGIFFDNDNLDFNHCNNEGKDAIAILEQIRKPIKDKKEYLKRMNKIIKGIK